MSEKEKKEVMEKVSAYQKKLERRPSPIIVNANELAKLKREDRPLYERILKALYCGSLNELRI
ncbi:MAG: hypothetical protein H3Z54_12930 [archaeon]|nr:hypothetical protein [archaeon]